jgi:protease YdgD
MNNMAFFWPAISANAFIRAGLSIALATLVSACATPVRVVDRPSQELPWSAAIGRLDSEEAGGSCSATLVSPDLILTASHCLYGRGSEVRIIDFAFTPALDAGRERLRPVPVAAVVAMGWPITPDASGELRGPPSDDWAVLRLTRAIDFVAPLKVEKLGVTGISSRIKSGAVLSHAGFGVYGVGSGKRLQIRDKCLLIEDSEDKLGTGRDVIKNTCQVIPGDSGGPILLTETNGARSVVGIVTNFWRSDSGEDQTSFGPSSIHFAGEIGATPAPAAATSTLSAP